MQLTWAEIKKFLALKIPHGGVFYVGNGTTAPYYIWMILAGEKLDCTIQIADTSDKNEFNLYYKNQLNKAEQIALGLADYNGKVFYRESKKFTVVGGQENSFYHKLSCESVLFGGSYELVGNVAMGDYIECSLVDKDGILGMGPNIELAKFLVTEYIMPTGEDTHDWDDMIKEGAGKIIPAGLYIKIVYFSAGTAVNNVTFVYRFELWR